MKTFTEEEKIIARCINKGYKWIARDKSNELTVYECKPYKLKHLGYWNEETEDSSSLYAFSQMFKSIAWKDNEPTLIRDIYDPHVLDDVEKRYLAAVLKPLPKVKKIWKDRSIQHGEYLTVVFDNGETMSFPDFKSCTMYKGMETGRTYTPEELKLKL